MSSLKMHTFGPHPVSVELIITAYIDMDADEIIRDEAEAIARQKAGKKIKALFRFPDAKSVNQSGGES